MIQQELTKISYLRSTKDNIETYFPFAANDQNDHVTAEDE